MKYDDSFIKGLKEEMQKVRIEQQGSKPTVVSVNGKIKINCQKAL